MTKPLILPITKQHEDSDFKKTKKKSPQTKAKFSSKTLQDLAELPSVHEVNSNGSSNYEDHGVSTKREKFGAEKRLSNQLALGNGRASKLSAYLYDLNLNTEIVETTEEEDDDSLSFERTPKNQGEESKSP